MIWRCRVLWEPRDLWIGVYWDKRPFSAYGVQRIDLYICLLPMLPIHVSGSRYRRDRDTMARSSSPDAFRQIIGWEEEPDGL